jgi:hypothetical protein
MKKFENGSHLKKVKDIIDKGLIFMYSQKNDLSRMNEIKKVKKKSCIYQ